MGLSESLDDAYASVSHDGTVFWSRPGHLRPVCKFEGLDAFPFDRLTCAMEIGSWTRSGKYRLHAMELIFQTNLIHFYYAHGPRTSSETQESTSGW